MTKPDVFGLEESVVQRICSVFAQEQHLEKVWIYGSRAKGNYRKGSDIDLCLEGALDLADLLKFRMLLDDLNLPYLMDLSLKHQIQNKDLVENIERCGVLFWVRDKVL